MSKFLEKILTVKKKEVFSLKKQKREKSVFLNRLKSLRDFGIIAEIKLRSPSAGNIADENFDPVKQATKYEKSGAVAISVVTENKFFGGSADILAQIKKTLEIPILQKDFIIDPVQIYEAKRYKSDALLLIARLLSPAQLSELTDICLQLNIEPFIEVFDEKDLRKACKTRARVIGVNARDLDTFRVDVGKAAEIIRKIPAKYIKIGLSGVTSEKEIVLYKNAGAKAAVIGSLLMKSPDINSTISKLLNI